MVYVEVILKITTQIILFVRGGGAKNHQKVMLSKFLAKNLLFFEN
jgi:hypothetical protein